jgi:hypothetical protein
LLLLLLLLLLGSYWVLESRRERSEHRIVAALRSRSNGGAAHRDEKPSLKTSLLKQIGIAGPVVGIDLVGMDMTDDEFRCLIMLRALESIHLSECNVSPRGLRVLAELPRLRVLRLSYCDGVSDASCSDIATIHSLGVLGVSSFSEEITGRNIQSLAKLPSLWNLELVLCTNISDEAIECLEAIKQLSHLDVRGTSISRNGMERLRRALPECRIIGDY